MFDRELSSLNLKVACLMSSSEAIAALLSQARDLLNQGNRRVLFKPGLRVQNTPGANSACFDATFISTRFSQAAVELFLRIAKDAVGLIEEGVEWDAERGNGGFDASGHVKLQGLNYWSFLLSTHRHTFISIRRSTNRR